MSTNALHVLIIDDSAVVRRTVERRLLKNDGWTVSAASDGIIALDRIQRDPPDVILLDLEMPRLDGLTFLRHLMRTHPIPVVVCSAFASPGTDMARVVTEIGAVDILPKAALALYGPEKLEDKLLTATLERAAEKGQAARPTLVDAAQGASPVAAPAAKPHLARETADPDHGSHSPGKVLLLGASMGGPVALRHVLGAFSSDAPACLIVQHMQEPFTESFAERLDDIFDVKVKVAEDGDAVLPGQVLLAPGDHHMVVRRSIRGVPSVGIVDGPPVSGHRPSVDVLFRSAAEALGPLAVAALMTGIGRDGADGLLALRGAGATTFAQHPEGCTAYGMPGAAVALGAAMHVVRLGELGHSLLTAASSTHALRRGEVSIQAQEII